VTVADNDGATDTQDIVISITGTNDAPVANDDSVTTSEDTSVVIDVLANDTDIDGDTLTVTEVTATNGSITINTDGTLSYQGNPDFNGTDTITYTVDDGNGGTDTATVTVNVSAVNDAPVSVDDTVTTNEDTSVIIDVLANDSDADFVDQLIQIRNMVSITKAQASINEYGTDDTGGDTDTLIKYELWIDTSALTTLDANATEIFGYQFDMDFNTTEVEALNTTLFTGENFGFYAANPANSAIYINETTGSVVDVSATAIVDIDTANDGAPLFLGAEKLIGTFYVNPIDANAVSVDITINNMLVVTDAGNIIQDDYSFSAVSELTIIKATATNGTVIINDDSTLTYVGNQDFNGTDTITYIVSDDKGSTDTSTVKVTVNVINDTPVVTNDTVTINEDTSVIINVLANDTDIDGDTLTVTSATAANGTVTINADSTLDYQGNPDFNGTDTITYTVDDGNGGTGTATVTVDVTAVNDAPVVTDGGIFYRRYRYLSS